MDEWIYGCQDCNAHIQKYIQMLGQEGLDRSYPKLGFKPKLEVDYGYHDPSVWQSVPQYTEKYIRG